MGRISTGDGQLLWNLNYPPMDTSIHSPQTDLCVSQPLFNYTEFLFKKFGSEPKGQMKEYFQIIHRLYPKIGLIETSRDFKYLGIYTSHKKPSASGTWFMLHYLSVKEMIKIEF